MKKYRNKYRIPSARLRGYDYGRNGAYFLTICTANKQQFFGQIHKKEMHLNNLGKLAHNIWLLIPSHFPFVVLGEFVIMPDHMHGILIIDKKDPSCVADEGGITGKYNPMFHDNISRIIRWYKGRCSHEMRKIFPEFRWHSRFHDHIIRNEQSFGTISRYIKNNPKRWKQSRFKAR